MNQRQIRKALVKISLQDKDIDSEKLFEMINNLISAMDGELSFEQFMDYC